MQNRRTERRSEIHPVVEPELFAREELHAKRTPDEYYRIDAYGRLMEAEHTLSAHRGQANGSEINGNDIGTLLVLPG